MIIVLPTSVALILGAVGLVFWIAEQPGKARKRREAREAKSRLRADLTAPPPSSRLPYGLSSQPEHGTRTDTADPPPSS